MSNAKTDGGPAFPGNGGQFVNGVHGIQPQGAYGMQGAEGMSLRDYFAAKAMQAWWSVDSGGAYPGPSLADKEEQTRLVEEWRSKLREESAVWSYQMADAMLKAREQ